MPKAVRRLLYLAIFAFPLLAAAANSVYILIFVLPPALIVGAVAFHALLKNQHGANFHMALAIIGTLLTLVALLSDSTTENYPLVIALLSWFLASSACLRLGGGEDRRLLIRIFAGVMATTSVVCAVAVVGGVCRLVTVNWLYLQVFTIGLLAFAFFSPHRKDLFRWQQPFLAAIAVVLIVVSINVHLAFNRDFSATRPASMAERSVFPADIKLAVKTDCVRILTPRIEPASGLKCEHKHFDGFDDNGGVVHGAYNRGTAFRELAPSGQSLWIRDSCWLNSRKALFGNGFEMRHSDDYCFTAASVDPTERWIAVGDSTGRVLIRPNVDGSDFIEVGRMEGGKVEEFKWWVPGAE